MTSQDHCPPARYRWFTGLLIALSVCLTGCATIVNRPTQIVRVDSTPSAAAVTITDETGAEVFRGMTPASVELLKGKLGYFSKKSYTVTVEKTGFAAQTIPLVTTYSAWYVLGNLPLGGFIGWFAIDPLSGRLYKLEPDMIQVKLADRPPYRE